MELRGFGEKFHTGGAGYFKYSTYFLFAVIQRLTKHIGCLCLVFLYCCLLICGSVIAQENNNFFKHLTVENGLSQNSVFSITEDKHGFIWIGTRTGGLNRFDGYSFKVYKKNEDDSLSISGNEVISLLEDDEGYLWAGTKEDGLNRYNPYTDNFTRYYFNPNDSQSINSNTVSCIYKNKDGIVYFGTNEGLCYYNRDTESFVRVTNTPIGHNQITVISPSANPEHVWIGIKKGIYYYHLQSNQVKAFFSNETKEPDGLLESDISSILEDNNGNIWVGTKNKGLSKMLSFKEGRFRHYHHNATNHSGLTSDVIRTLHQDSKGIIWIGTKIALEALTPDQQDKESPQFVHYTEEAIHGQGLSQNSIFSFFEDSQHNKWIGTYSGGVNFLSSELNKFKHFQHNIYTTNSLSENVVSSFTCNKRGLWIGTEGGGLNVYKPQTKKFTSFLSNPIPQTHIKSLFIDKNNQLWVGTYNGLLLFDFEKNEFKKVLDGNIYTIEEGIAHELWVGTFQGLFLVDKSTLHYKKYHHIDTNNTSISNNNIYKIYKDSGNDIWIATKHGLNLYNRQEDNFIQFYHQNNNKTSLSHSKITCITEDTLKNLWIGTIDGLNRFDKQTNSFTHYNEKNGIPGNSISNLMVDDKGFLWVSTILGLTKINPYQLSNLAANDTICLRKYDQHDGLLQGEFRQNSSFKDSLGNIYLGGVNGYSVFHPQKMENNTLIPAVIITDFKLFNKSVPIGTARSPLQQSITQTKKIILNHHQSILSFTFSALNYTSPEKNKYAYKLEGYDKNWVSIGNKREVTYTNLPSGTYCFRVKASNNDNIWNHQGTSIELIIQPPWWKTGTFLFFLSLVIFSSMISIYLFKISTLKKQKILLAMTVRERTKQLQQVNISLTESNKQILAQKEAILGKNKELESQNEKIQKAYRNIETISKIGNELQLNKQVEEVIEIAYNKLSSIMTVPMFSIGIYDPEEDCLTFSGTKENGKTLEVYKHNLNRKDRFSVWCFKHQKELLIKDLYQEYPEYITKPVEDPGRIIAKSIIYMPLVVEKRKIGVITVQSDEIEAYTINHLNILRSFGVYVGIAIDNANAYNKIDTQAKELNIQKTWLEESKDTQNKFYSILAHDLKTPFNAMLGFLEIVELSFFELPKKQTYEYIKVISDSAKLSFRFIENLLEWSQSQQNIIPFKPIKLKVKDAADTELRILESMVKEKNIELTLQCTPNDLYIHADEHMLSAILRNLVSNAIKFTEPNGKVSVLATKEKGKILFSISDTGIGVPEDHIDSLFKLDQKYTRLGTRNEMGTGMGLALCREFVEKHNGKIWVKSTQGIGTTFYFTITNE